MVELRSGKHVDLGPVRKARSSSIPRPIGKTIRPLKGQKRFGLNMSLSFEIYEDDPNAPRPDLEIPPQHHREAAAIDQENEEPDDLAPIGDAVQSSAPIAQLSRSPARPVSSRPPLHQILQDDDVKTGQLPRHAGKGSKGKDTAQSLRVRKSTRSEKPSEQVPSIRIQDSRPSQPTVKRVSMLGLR